MKTSMSYNPQRPKHSLFHQPSLIFMLVIFPSLIELHKPTKADELTHHDECHGSFECANVPNLGYPFYDGDKRPDYCGYPGFEVNCSGPKAEITLNTTQSYYLLDYTNDKTLHTISVAREDYWDNYCPTEPTNTTMNFSLFSYTSADINYTFGYQCAGEVPTEYHQFPCPGGDTFVYAVPPAAAVGLCQNYVLVPVNDSFVPSLANPKTMQLQAVFHSGFELQWFAENDNCDVCLESGGACVNYAGPDTTNKQSAGAGKPSHKAVLIASASALGAGLLIILSVFVIMRSLKKNQILGVSQGKTDQEIEAFLRDCGITGPKRYTYAYLKRVTNSFKDKLGEGGYGMVYRGKLHNGRQVAVKILRKSRGDAMEFINEVASIGRTNHKNIVTLLGFCYKGHRRALVYDFMPNGSLEKFIYRGNNHQSLPWEKLFQISVGIARGLEYLHQGCTTRILHFDIKPHNILLDEDFCPKISDFGLAKSCFEKESIISMSVARGTVGYIAPEVFLRSFGGVSQKSDVYSYGMLVLEMVGCRKNSNAQVECSSEQYFPQWIYKQLEREEHDHPETLTGKERELQRKMVLVSLWCIQTNPQSRPTMTRVIEMLEGNSESLQIPPMPTLDSPPRSTVQQGSSTSHTISVMALPNQNLQSV